MFHVHNRWSLLGLAMIPYCGFGSDFSFTQSDRTPLLAQFSVSDLGQQQDQYLSADTLPLKNIHRRKNRGTATQTGSHSKHKLPVLENGRTMETIHEHDSGTLMFEYRFMRMFQQGLLKGAKSVTPEEILQEAQDTNRWVDANGEALMGIGTEMTMDMHMFMAMYSPTEKLSLMVMLNYLTNNMSMLMRPMDGMMPMVEITEWESIFMESAGIGDTQVAMKYKLDDYFPFDPLLTVGVSLPTGSIDKSDETGVLPYNMQLGSGTYDLLVAYGMDNMWENWHFGGEAKYLWRTLDNAQGYRLGDRYSIESFLKYDLPTKTTLRGSVKHESWDEIHGRDDRIIDNPNYYGGMRTDLWIGVSQALPFGFTVEFNYGLPINQKLNEVQMQTDWQMQVGLGWMWM